MKPLLKDKLSVLAEDSAMLEAIDEVFREMIDEENPQVGANDTDEVIGQRYRAYTQAVVILDNAMTTIKAYKEEKSNTNKFRKER